MKQKHGPWYWLSLTNVGLLIGAISGWFGRDAQQEASDALRDTSPAAPVLAFVGLALLTILVVLGLFLLLR